MDTICKPHSWYPHVTFLKIPLESDSFMGLVQATDAFVWGNGGGGWLVVPHGSNVKSISCVPSMNIVTKSGIRLAFSFKTQLTF